MEDSLSAPEEAHSSVSRLDERVGSLEHEVIGGISDVRDEVFVHVQDKEATDIPSSILSDAPEALDLSVKGDLSEELDSEVVLESVPPLANVAIDSGWEDVSFESASANNLIELTDNEVSFDDLLDDIEFDVGEGDDLEYPNIEEPVYAVEDSELDFSEEIAEFWKDNLQDSTDVTVTGFDYDYLEVAEIDNELGLIGAEIGNEEGADINLLGLIKQQVSEIISFEEHREAEAMISNIEQSLSSAINTILETVDLSDSATIRIDINEIENIDEIRDRVGMLLEALNKVSDERVIDRFIELAVKDILRDMQSDHSFQLVDRGTHEKKYPLWYSVSNFTNNFKGHKNRVLFLIGRLSVLASR